MSKIYDELYSHVAELTIIDTHEHLPSYETERDCPTDFLKEYLCSYLGDDLVSAGLKYSDYIKVCDSEIPLLERWKLLKPIIDKTCNTAYYRQLSICTRDIYGAIFLQVKPQMKC